MTAGVAFAALLSTLQPYSSVEQTAVGPEASQLDDVQVIATSPRQMVQNFVRGIAAPVAGRGLATWREPICVGVFGVQQDAAQFIADRVSWVASDIGLEVAEPGCRPNIFVVGSDDANATIEKLIEEVPRGFRFGGSRMDHGATLLRRLANSERPVLAWHSSIPIDADTGQIAVRIQGDTDIRGLASAPVVRIRGVSRRRQQLQDNLLRAIVVVDMNRLGGVDILQLSDYVALSSLAQIDTSVGAAGYRSILNVFEASGETPHLTDWDLLYLKALYGGNPGRMDLHDQIAGIVREARAILRGRQALP